MNTLRPLARLGTAGIVTALVAIAVTAPPASAAVSGLLRQIVTSANDSKPLKSVTAVCPDGRQVVGAEFSISGGVGSIVLDDLVPSATSVRVDAREDANGTSANWLVRAIARCADPLPGYEIVSATSGSTSDSKSVSANCTPGKQLVGSGAFINGGLGEVVMDALIPQTSGMRVTAFEGDNGGTANNWDLNAVAICANPLQGRQVVFATSTSTSGGKTQDVACPAGTQVLSAGFDIFGGLGEVTVTGMSTAPRLGRTATVAALEDDNGMAADWTARVFAVCAVA